MHGGRSAPTTSSSSARCRQLVRAHVAQQVRQPQRLRAARALERDRDLRRRVQVLRRQRRRDRQRCGTRSTRSSVTSCSATSIATGRHKAPAAIARPPRARTSRSCMPPRGARRCCRARSGPSRSTRSSTPLARGARQPEPARHRFPVQQGRRQRAVLLVFGRLRRPREGVPVRALGYAPDSLRRRHLGAQGHAVRRQRRFGLKLNQTPTNRPAPVVKG